MGVTFKCNRSGQTVTFTYEHDIKSMREHPDYTEVVEVTEASEQDKPQRGRPRKVVEDTDTDSI
jgi:hypothetical protein